MDFNKPYKIILFIGIIIFVLAFVFQVIKLYKNGKNTISFSPISWLLNFLGRYLWIIFGIITQEPIITIGEGSVGILTIPILYYAYRNNKNDGIYEKSHFKKHYFALKIFSIVVVLATLVMGLLDSANVVNLHNLKNWIILMITLTASFLTGFAFLPQTIKTIKSRKTKSTSIYLTSFFVLGNILFITSLIMKMVITGEYVSNIGGILFPIIATALMCSITWIKLANIFKFGEK